MDERRIHSVIESWKLDELEKIHTSARDKGVSDDGCWNFRVRTQSVNIELDAIKKLILSNTDELTKIEDIKNEFGSFCELLCIYHKGVAEQDRDFNLLKQRFICELLSNRCQELRESNRLNARWVGKGLVLLSIIGLYILLGWVVSNRGGIPATNAVLIVVIVIVCALLVALIDKRLSRAEEEW